MPKLPVKVRWPVESPKGLFPFGGATVFDAADSLDFLGA